MWVPMSPPEHEVKKVLLEIKARGRYWPAARD
jgi:hypothetical protein